MKKLAAAGVILGLLLAVILLTGRESRPHSLGPASANRSAAPATSPASASFTYLASQHSNRCNLQRSELLSYPHDQRLQGSCCQPMDRKTYERQLRELRRYAGVSVIPRDPYDILAGLAQRLLGYQRTIKLTRSQQATYAGAMQMSRQKGPCCCRCWRWDAFAGLSNYLIARKGWTARQVARVIDAVEGCGGANSASGHPRPAT